MGVAAPPVVQGRDGDGLAAARVQDELPAILFLPIVVEIQEYCQDAAVALVSPRVVHMAGVACASAWVHGRHCLASLCRRQQSNDVEGPGPTGEHFSVTQPHDAAIAVI